MIGLTLKHLRYFEALARHAHFGRAADSVGISQPALSVQMKELERMLGGPLVERLAREIRLTALGEDFLARTRNILMEVRELDDLKRSASGPLAGRLRLGVIPTVAPYLLPRIMKAMSIKMPALELQPRENITRSLIADLANSTLDAAIVALPISEPTLQEVALFEEEFLLLRPQSEDGKPVPSPDALRKRGLLLLAEGHCFRDQALSFCKMGADEPRYLMEGSSLSTLVQMVGAGMGLTLIPEIAVPLETKSAPVVVARFPEPRPSRTIGIVWRRTNPLAAKLDDFGRIVRDVVTKPPVVSAS
ncbi:hydrogen peroxide-inducible genes activator [Loktanella sp. M215]|uniref:hydrogen peroxide-inducible genes activator n=1 Tax=Loktanella sp. M215 TaxID=2675431 RepID=UPI001F45DD30|nr:hydrogen peroxide-inducible genes activator [Loktanella sp. M215]MCF7702325.1 LysR family transcriptional regulator [Loktanella sp. M215]